MEKERNKLQVNDRTNGLKKVNQVFLNFIKAENSGVKTHGAKRQISNEEEHLINNMELVLENYLKHVHPVLEKNDGKARSIAGKLVENFVSMNNEVLKEELKDLAIKHNDTKLVKVIDKRYEQYIGSS